MEPPFLLRSQEPHLFTGIEVEHSPYFGEKTLFVVGTVEKEKIEKALKIENCTHLYLGANQHFSDYVIELAKEFSNLIHVTVDIPYLLYIDEVFSNELLHPSLKKVHFMLSAPLVVSHRLLSIKVDDSVNNRRNPGVWVFPITSNTKNFTPWSAYKNDVLLGEKF